MSFLVQNDSGSVVGATAYISVSEFRSYFSDRGVETTDFDDATVQGAIVRATDYLDGRFRFLGERSTVEQRTEWPRIGVVDQNDLSRDGIPAEVKEACCEYTLVALNQEINPNPEQDSTGRSVQSKSSAVGPISESVTYVGGAIHELPKYPKADVRLRRLVVRSGETARA